LKEADASIASQSSLRSLCSLGLQIRASEVERENPNDLDLA